MLNKKVHNWVRFRQGDVFTTPDGRDYIIIEENENSIHLYRSYPDLADYFAVFLDKKDRMFSMVALNPDDDSKIITGQCEIF